MLILLQPGNIALVFIPAHGELVRQHIGLREDEEGQPIDGCRDTVLPSLIETNGFDSGDEIDSTGDDADLHDRIIFNKVVDGKVRGRGPKYVQRADHTLAILGIGLDPEVEVAGRSGVAMGSESVSPDNEELNLLFL